MLNISKSIRLSCREDKYSTVQWHRSVLHAAAAPDILFCCLHVADDAVVPWRPNPIWFLISGRQSSSGSRYQDSASRKMKFLT